MFENDPSGRIPRNEAVLQWSQPDTSRTTPFLSLAVRSRSKARRAVLDRPSPTQACYFQNGFLGATNFLGFVVGFPKATVVS